MNEETIETFIFGLCLADFGLSDGVFQYYM